MSDGSPKVLLSTSRSKGGTSRSIALASHIAAPASGPEAGEGVRFGQGLDRLATDAGAPRNLFDRSVGRSVAGMPHLHDQPAFFLWKARRQPQTKPQRVPICPSRLRFPACSPSRWR